MDLYCDCFGVALGPLYVAVINNAMRSDHCIGPLGKLLLNIGL